MPRRVLAAAKERYSNDNENDYGDRVEKFSSD